jgi:hypothetical protein
MRTVLSFASLVVLATACATTLSSPEPESILLPTEFVYPNGIATVLITQSEHGQLLRLRPGESRIETVLRIPDPLSSGERELQTVGTGLECPVNLSIASEGVAYVSESRVRLRKHFGSSRSG